MAWTCLLGHTSLGPKMKGLCANTCEGTGQVKLVVIKNITLLSALPLLTLHIGVLKIAMPEQLLTAVNDEILCIYIVLHTPTRP